MKKRYILLFAIFLVMVSGCSIKKANYDSIDDIINNVLLEKPTSSNTSFNGYSYYIPNTLKIENHKIRMISATCPDHLCIKQGTINKKGQSIICLPHKLIVEVVSGGENKQDDQAY